MRPHTPACLLLIFLILFGPSCSFKLRHEHLDQNQNLEPNSRLRESSTCIGCVLLVSITEQLAQVHNSSIQEAMVLLCSYLPSEPNLSGICALLIELFGSDLIKLLNYKWNGDIVCHALKLCNNVPGEPICHLYQMPKGGLKRAFKEAEKIVLQSNTVMKNAEVISDVFLKLCSLPILRSICETMESSVPLEDFDHDNFSFFPTLRGYHWRGRDCNDMDKSVYPGKRPRDWDALEDSNCNGIWGFDPEDGIPYEKKFCDGTDAKGIIIIGDSAAAHFHIPMQWLSAINMSKETFADLPLALSNELDWPQFSLYTGFQNSTIGGWTKSLYLQLRKWNRCNHRDYQNIARNVRPFAFGDVITDTARVFYQFGRNPLRSLFVFYATDYTQHVIKNTKLAAHHLISSQGGGSSHNVYQYVESLARNQELDRPAVVFYAMVGNDVCNRNQDTLKYMTTPQEMKSNVLTTLEYLDSRLPNGSHVVLVQLADGRFLWDSIHDRYHPIGQLNKNVKYKHVYSFLSCLKINPCEGWMTENETLRNLTTERADQLSSILSEIASSYKFKHFKLIYFDNLYQKVTVEWSKLGREPWELIEPVDGFHPSQIASAVGAEIIWKEALLKWPELFGKENARNKEIIAKFADQGGH